MQDDSNFQSFLATYRLQLNTASLIIPVSDWDQNLESITLKKVLLF